MAPPAVEALHKLGGSLTSLHTKTEGKMRRATDSSENSPGHFRKWKLLGQSQSCKGLFIVINWQFES